MSGYSRDFTVRLHPVGVNGVRWSAARAGLYDNPSRLDVALMEWVAGSSISLQTTKNRFAAAPIQWCRSAIDRYSNSSPGYALVNAGNANAGTGAIGLTHISTLRQAINADVECPDHQFLPFSTGVIGEPLPVEKIRSQVSGLLDSLEGGECGWQRAARAILTTDTRAKAASVELSPSDSDTTPIRVCGIAKGSGMIHPDMATMLSFLACDANVPEAWFDERVKKAVEQSYNRITVDGDTSTNDACLSVLTRANSKPLADGDRETLNDAIQAVLHSLSIQIVKDGEGAQVVFCVRVSGASNEGDAKSIARTVATSPLVKTAMGARDANWGRILAAIGRAPVERLDIARVDVDINGVSIVRQGTRAASLVESVISQALKQENIDVNIGVNQGKACARYYSCDLSEAYARINRDYRT